MTGCMENLERLEQAGQLTIIRMEPFFQATDNCRICGREVAISTWGPNYGVPMYEDMPVPPEWSGEWGGFCACKECHDRYERGELKMWTVRQLEYVTRPNTCLGRHARTIKQS